MSFVYVLPLLGEIKIYIYIYKAVALAHCATWIAFSELAPNVVIKRCKVFSVRLSVYLVRNVERKIEKIEKNIKVFVIVAEGAILSLTDQRSILSELLNIRYKIGHT